ncbi:MAG: dynamin family protein [Rubricoccaceae bacterium]|nr:dynamin family protein [Rubricoccaceae bacterium]
MDLLSPDAADALARERALLGRLGRLLGESGADEATLRRLGDLAEGLDDLFLLLVVGEFNAGKSSVVNALFGAPVLEEGPVPTTDKIAVLRWGERAETHRRSDYVTERRHPHPLLRHLALVDTPGTNSIVREHQALTEDFVPRADLVLFVTSFDRPLTESERVFLDFIHAGWGKRVVVVLNKADLAESEAALAQVIEHVRSGVERHFGFVPRVFPVAARLALAAKAAHPERPQDDPRWDASGYPAFEAFLTETLTADERLALKLTAPLDAADGLVAGLAERLDAARVVLQKDEAGLAALRARFDEKEGVLREAFGRAAAEVDRELLEMEKRGVRFLDDAIRVSKLRMLRDRDRFKEEFARQVLRDAERRIEERAGEAVDALLRNVYDLWNETYAHLAAQREAGQAADGGPRDAFLYNRDEVFRDVMREAKRTVDQYDLKEEARRLLENARAAAALFAGTQAAALGLGALATVLVAATAFDVTGGFVAAGALAVGGFVLLPIQKRKAIREFSARVEALREDLGRALSAQLDEEVAEAMARVHRLVAPLAEHPAAARERLDAATAEADTLHADLGALRTEIRRRFGEARSLSGTPAP